MLNFSYLGWLKIEIVKKSIERINLKIWQIWLVIKDNIQLLNA
jgi:hypothetical protein